MLILAVDCSSILSTYHNLRFRKVDKELKKLGSVCITTDKLAVCFEIRTTSCSPFRNYLQTDASSVIVYLTNKAGEKRWWDQKSKIKKGTSNSHAH